ncbi:MAG: rhomboid family intramembrane serine protease [Planctomycetes bacterium]|nr:rhomboid family intramembrane serine protease [Planctomycetota bacterium]
MGIYDRDYGRDYGSSGQPGIHLGGPRTLTTNLVLFTLAVYGLQLLTQPTVANFPGDDGLVTNWFSLYGNTLTQPWRVFEFLTYGFLHSTQDFKHILFNMFGLWMFGRTVEARCGRREYLAFYLLAIVFAGSAWYAAEFFTNQMQAPIQMLGASGGLSAVLILFALNNPKQLIYIWGIFPLPAWVFAIFFVGSDVLGAMQRTSGVAFTAHLGGALFAFLYWQGGWKLENWLPGNFSLSRFKKKGNLWLHDPEHPDQGNVAPETDERVDEILKKIQDQGQDSLTWRERRILEKASKEYQRKRQ